MKRKLKICIVLLLLFYIFPLYAQSTGETGAVYIGKNLSESDIYAEVFSEMQYWWDQGATSTDIKEKLTKEDTDLICSALNQYDVSVNEAYSVVLAPANSDEIENFICVIKSKKKNGKYTYKWYNVGIFRFD